MKKIQYLSPTSISKFYENPTEFYLNYLADKRPPRIPQTRPMSIGSSFDAYAKSYLHEKLFGKGHDPKFEFEAIFEAQVEEHNRDWALSAGKYAFDIYHASGALGDLMVDLNNAIGTPRFEIEIRGVVSGVREGITKDVGDITLLGKPDIFYINKFGANVIFDWKVNGFCSNSAVSPMPGYVRLREKNDMGHWRDTGFHKKAQVMIHNGVKINVAGYLEYFDKDWARQLGIYGWLCGADVGSEFITAIDQLVCKPGGDRPIIRVAEHRLRIAGEHQWKVFAEAQHVWSVVHSDHIFRDLGFEESQKRCALLDGTAEALVGEGTANDRWFSNTCRAE